MIVPARRSPSPSRLYWCLGFFVFDLVAARRLAEGRPVVTLDAEAFEVLAVDGRVDKDRAKALSEDELCEPGILGAIPVPDMTGAWRLILLDGYDALWRLSKLGRPLRLRFLSPDETRTLLTADSLGEWPPWRGPDMIDLSGVPQRFHKFLHALKGLTASPQAGRWYACCPAHDDTRPSLTVSIGRKGNLIVSCNAPAACSAKAIVAAVGMTMADLFADDRPDFGARRGTPARSPSVVYQYRYADGRLAYEALRFDNPRDFAMRRPNPDWVRGSGRSRYIASLEGVELVPYRLPELLESGKTSPERWVNLSEGEKCADSMAAIGAVSTTHALGAGHWRREYAQHFRGRKVAIWYDLDPYNDKLRCRPGPAWAVQAARDLVGLASEVRICRVPELPDDSKGDVADWIFNNAGRGQTKLRGQLFDVVRSTTSYYPGWEYDGAFVRHMRSIHAALPPGSDMNEAITDVTRRLNAAVEGVRLESLPRDLAETAAWCMWLAQTLDPRMRAGGLELGPALTSAQKSEPAGADREEDAPGPQDAATPEDASQDEPEPC